MRILELDYETYGTAELRGTDSVGVYNYCSHPETLPLMLGYKLPEEIERRLWFPHVGPMPAGLLAALKDPGVFILAYNSAFERLILKYKCDIDIPAARFIDPQVYSRYLSMPGKLEQDCKILDLPVELAKDSRGEELIDLFCKPHMTKKTKTEPSRQVRYDHLSHPKEWQEFGKYCLQDLVAEVELLRRQTILQAFPLPPFEQKLWEFDQKVNDRGWPVDLEFVRKAYKLAVRSKQEALDNQNKITGLENANSTDQLKPWLKARGYPFNTLRKETVDSVLKDPDVKLTDEARAVLKARREASSTAYQKLGAIMRRVSSDGRIHGMFAFMGSARCGRWAGSGVQPHNFPRPMVLAKTDTFPGYDFEDMDVVHDARAMVMREDYEGIKEKYKSVLLTVKCLLRTAFKAADGEVFEVCDLNAIETRAGAWLAECKTLLDVFTPFTDQFGEFFPNGKDPYLAFASKMYGIPYEKLWADYKGRNGKEAKMAAKRMRQIAKPGVLAAIYRQSGGTWGHAKKGYKDHGDDCNANETYTEQNGKVKKIGKKHCYCETIYDKVKTGLWKYAEDMGVEMSQEQAASTVRIFRDSYEEIPNCWYAIENAVQDVMRGTDTVRYVGPNGCVKIDKLNIAGRGAMMRMRLPSGRYLHYLDARLESCKMPWQKDGEDVYRDSLVYAGTNQETKQWDVWVQTHGGHLFQNLDQGISRDILAAKLLELEDNDLPICGHVHDEGVSLVPKDPFSPNFEDMVRIMSAPVSWAPGLLLGADGFSDSTYHK